MEGEIKKFITEAFLDKTASVDANKSLFESGFIDSLGLFKLLDHLEKKYGIEIEMSEITIDNFDTVKKIVKFIKKKS